MRGKDSRHHHSFKYPSLSPFMPELPEVEVVCRSLRDHVLGLEVRTVGTSGKSLRSFSGEPAALPLAGQRVHGLQRRAKNLVFLLDDWWMLVHLGMSGQLLWLPRQAHRPAHSHVWWSFSEGQLVYNDPRRFGDVRLVSRGLAGSVEDLPSAVLGAASSGLEPFSSQFDGDWLYAVSRGVRQAVKPWLMRGDLVVGVGNIYASEALFRAGIHPGRPAGRIGSDRYRGLVQTIREVLSEAIAGGGSSLRDFVSSDGSPGHFASSHRVYGRQGEPCVQCGRAIVRLVQAQRASYFCTGCQR